MEASQKSHLSSSSSKGTFGNRLKLPALWRLVSCHEDQWQGDLWIEDLVCVSLQLSLPGSEGSLQGTAYLKVGIVFSHDVFRAWLVLAVPHIDMQLPLLVQKKM